MVPRNLDVAYFQRPLESALKDYEELFRGEITFGDFKDFELTPKKPNYARTVVPVNYEGSKIGDMYVIVFRPGDGTGAVGDYGLELADTEVFSPRKKEGLIPRSKKGIICEGYFPMFSLNEDSAVALHAGSMQEITVGTRSRELERAWILGQSRPLFLEALKESVKLQPRVYYTVGTATDSTTHQLKRFGDPHSIYDDLFETNATQVAGFLAITDEKSPLLNITKTWVLPRGYY